MNMMNMDVLLRKMNLSLLALLVYEVHHYMCVHSEPPVDWLIDFYADTS